MAKAEKEGLIMILLVGDGKDANLVTNVPVTAKGELHDYLLRAAAMIGADAGN